MYPSYHRPHRFLWSLVLVGLVIFVIKAPTEAAYLAHLGLGPGVGLRAVAVQPAQLELGRVR